MSENLGEKVIKNGVILPYIDFDEVAILNEKNEVILGKTKGKFEIAQNLSESVVFLGFFGGHYGHFITEEIARLWWILEHDIKGVKFVYSSFKNKLLPFESYIFSLFKLDKQNTLNISKPTKFKEIILPDESFFNEKGLEKHRKMIDFITSHITPNKKFKKIYLSRRKFEKADYIEFGEEFFEEIYAKQGFYIAHPETLTPKEQLELMGGELLCSTWGHTASQRDIFAL